MRYRWSPANVTSVIGGITLPLLIGYFWLGLFETFGWGPAVVLLVLTAASGIWWLAEAVWEYRHRGDLEALAGHVGWEFRDFTSDYRYRFRSYPFDQGTDREDIHLVRGTFHGRPCASFTHRYNAGDDDTMSTLSFEITLVELPVALPTVDIVPEDTMARLTKLLGGADIDFESAQFNRHWRVKSDDARYAHALLHPRMLHRLNREDARGSAIRFEERAVMMWSANRSGAGDLTRRLGVLTALAAMVPPHLEREYIELELAQERESEQVRTAQEKAWSSAPLWATTPGALSSGYRAAQDARENPPQPPLA